jgi:hypothetical protein
MALGDSGADFSIFPREIAKDYLKLDLAKFEPRQFSGTTGAPQIAYPSDVLITVLDGNGGEIGWEILTRCGFAIPSKCPVGRFWGRLDSSLFSRPRSSNPENILRSGDGLPALLLQRERFREVRIAPSTARANSHWACDSITILNEFRTTKHY